jgi:hypothetical protein
MVNVYTGNTPNPNFTDRELHEQYMTEQKTKYGGANQDAAPADKPDVGGLPYSVEDMTLADFEVAQILVNMSSSSPHQDPSTQIEAAQAMIVLSQSGVPASASVPAPSSAPVPGLATAVPASTCRSYPKITLPEYSLWKASGRKKYSEYLTWKKNWMDLEPADTPPQKIAR